MEALPLHPRLVHLPMALAALMPLLSFGVLVAWWRGWLPRRAWALAALAQLALTVGSVAALRTGEAEEHRVEAVTGEAPIEEHEEAAEAFTWAGVVVLLLAAAAVAPKQETLARGLALAASAGTLAVLVLGVRVGDAGGSLVYRHNAGSAYGTGGAAPAGAVPHAEPRKHEKDDD